jgi:hypothetical protein
MSIIITPPLHGTERSLIERLLYRPERRAFGVVPDHRTLQYHTDTGARVYVDVIWTCMSWH